MTVFIEKAGVQRKLGSGSGSQGTVVEHMSAPKIVIHRTSTGAITADDDRASSLTERSLEEIEAAQRIYVDSGLEEPRRVRVRKGVFGGMVEAD
ncbi:hypothetical protein [Candidatus Methanoperedens nitratireducens]|uniref:Uncharacterized protein n=1 Tax=Candidatus Methanoperedens nitratireducens TaxID=1392998 RepID=A0A284VSU2_9EURY|nr:hypothetical protein [Candidatus Methanoperedens nitroreducens]SNQ62268.1 hypothetical protein MNV_660006 [Candidatus Methanoperedens nitroreducens]